MSVTFSPLVHTQLHTNLPISEAQLQPKKPRLTQYQAGRGQAIDLTKITDLTKNSDDAAQAWLDPAEKHKVSEIMARNILNNKLTDNKLNAEAYNRLADALICQHKITEAEAAAIEGLKIDLDPEHYYLTLNLYSHLSHCLYEQGDYAAVVGVTRNAHELPSFYGDRKATLCYYRSQSLLNLMKLNEAKETAVNGLKAILITKHLKSLLETTLESITNTEKLFADMVAATKVPTTPLAGSECKDNQIHVTRVVNRAKRAATVTSEDLHLASLSSHNPSADITPANDMRAASAGIRALDKPSFRFRTLPTPSSPPKTVIVIEPPKPLDSPTIRPLARGQIQRKYR